MTERSDADRFTETLRERAEPAWTEATEHRFTRELGDGSLDREVFAAYLVQDYAFVETLTGTFGHAVGDAPSTDARRPLVEFLDTLTAEENDYFERALAALGVPAASASDPNRAEPTAAFEDLLRRAEREGGYAETLAVLVPAEWVYLTWARREAAEPPERWYYEEWIDLHSVPAFESFVGHLRDQLDARGPALSPRRRELVARLFERTVDLEVAFFDAAYDLACDVAGEANGSAVESESESAVEGESTVEGEGDGAPEGGI